MLADLAEDLAGNGWDVRVITGRTAYAASAQPAPGAEVHNGVRVKRVRGSRFGRTHLVGRMLDYLTYISGAALALVRLPTGSIIVGMSDPPMLAALALVFARLHRGKAVYWVQDLFPDLAARLGVVKESGTVNRVAAAAARVIHAQCDLLVALGPAMARALIERGGSAERIRVVHNWADAEAVTPLHRHQNPFVRAHGLEDRFVVQYSGNAGRAHTFDAVCGAMRLLRNEPDICFQFIGGGRQMPVIRRVVSENGLQNVQFLDYLERDELRHSLPAANLSLVTEHEGVVGLLVPSKAYGIMASGRPLIFIGNHTSDVAAIVRETGCGRIVAPNDTEGLAKTILFLRDHPAEAAVLGARGRLAAETTYNRRESTSLWSRSLDALVSAPVFPNMSLHTGVRLPHS